MTGGSLPGLEHVVLTESWVLDIRVSPHEVCFIMEAVLAGSHPLYEAPRPGEQFCYKMACWIFHDVRSVAWVMGGPPAVDATGEYDYGHIDEVLVDPLKYVLLGDLGRVEIISGVPEFVFQD